LVHIFCHFWKALWKSYNTAKVCGPKFKNGGDLARGAKDRKNPLLQKTFQNQAEILNFKPPH